MASTTRPARLGHANRIIASLPDPEFERLSAGMEQVQLHSRLFLFLRDQPLTHVYFPLSGMVSLITTMQGGASVEMGTVGREGVVGVPMIAQSEPVASMDAVVQLPGEAVMVPTDTFRAALPEAPMLADLVQRFADALFRMVGQNAACNRLHTTDERLSRWLLMTSDRAESEVFPLTHEFLSQMLGVRRASVSEAAEGLHGEDLIRYHRGVISLVDRPGLERRACECYQVIRTVFDRALP